MQTHVTLSLTTQKHVFPYSPHCSSLYLVWNLCLLLCGLRNQISSSAHSGVVRGHVDFLALGLSSCDEKSARLKSR